MKKIILTSAIALSVVFGISRSAYATAGKKAEVSTVLTNVSKIGGIEVHGNVQLYLTSGDEDKVKVYNNYYADNALVQEQNGVLKITSYGSEKLVVWVTAANLLKLTVFDDAEVKSFGKLSTMDLDVTLHDNATAKLDMDAITASITLTDHARAALSGYVESGSLQYNHWSHLDTNNFAVVNLNKTVTARPAKHFHRDELAAL